MGTKSIGVVASDTVTLRREPTINGQKSGLLNSKADFSQFLTSTPQKAPPALGQLDLSNVSRPGKAPPALGQLDLSNVSRPGKAPPALGQLNLADILGKRQP